MRLIDAHIAVECIKNSDLPNHWKNALISCLLSIPTIAPPPNDPLTLEELREMDGEPVWAVWMEEAIITQEGWSLVETELDDVASTNFRFDFEIYGLKWLAYRRKKENK